MGSQLNKDDIDTCCDCLYCSIQNKIWWCGYKGIETEPTNICIKFDYCESDYYAGA